MTATLEAGRFLGRILAARQEGDLRLAHVHYTAGARRHAHERPYFCLIRRGRYAERYGRRSRDCRPATVAYHPAGMHHAITLESAPVRALNVELGPAWLQWMADLGLASDQPSEAHGGAGAEAARRLFHLLDGGSDFLGIESLTAEILAALCQPPVPGPRTPGWVEDLPDLLESTLGELSLRDLAAAAGVYPVHFAAVFRLRFGCSVGDYARRRRIERARRLLTEGQSLAQVAAAAGFADQSHLTRWFKRSTGMTPGRYRTLLAFKT